MCRLFPYTNIPAQIILNPVAYLEKPLRIALKKAGESKKVENDADGIFWLL